MTEVPAGLGGRLTPGARPAVVVVDLINGFTDPACPPGADLGEVVAATARLLAHARARGWPVFFTTISYAPGEPDSLVWLRKMPALAALAEGTPWVEVDARLKGGEPVLVKKQASAFHGTGLAALLAESGADTLVVTGATTSGCVRATVIDACALNYPVFVPAECVGDRQAGPHAANLYDIDAKYADVIGLEEVMALWS
ncbi:N-carbamoylsarcosine amidase [Sphaerisporangium krabiense]|uniref:Nicotinamidase-related amidase n=1 Tax=Sphaerisporangium krabiense TaxID=763782 RepID=A0A7W8Z928_9ACTN|nr:isochorismatase family protein [Sphaerisporangium krabiense]MBB5629627.1 nicotinamidase-related amidase [Sphaerisporangium krabiense]GII63725.1 N-carbamoylsarcosine amidase [Sphaerisporangium krabiense]